MKQQSAPRSIIDPGVAEDPYAFYREIQQLGPVLWDEKAQAYLLHTYDVVSAVYKDPAFSTRSYDENLSFIHGRTVLAMDGTEHVRNRALLTPHFRGTALAGLEGLIARTATKLLDEIAEKRAAALVDRLDPATDVDLVQEFTGPYPATVIADMLGLPEQDIAEFAGWYAHIIEFVGNLAADEGVSRRGLEAKAALEAYMMPLIAQRRRDPGSDLISALVGAEVDGARMDDVSIKSYISLLLTAGGETTDKALGSMIKNLLLNRSQWEAVGADRELVDSAIAETLRFAPPSQITSRQAEADILLAGVPVPKGSKLLILAGAANRDPARWGRPDEFDIHRTDLNAARAFSGAADHLAFGSGRHFCLGAMLARAEMRTGLNMLLDRHPKLRIADGHPPHDVGLKTRGLKSLIVRLD